MTEIEALIVITASTFACNDAKSAEPNPYFARPPYKPFLMNAAYPDGAHGIYNAQGFNCLRFRDKPGAVFTTKENAIALTERWNT